MKRYVLLTLALTICLAPATARADSCDSSHAQDVARQGYSALDGQRWFDAKTDAGQLAILAQVCNDPHVRVPSVVHSAYIGTAALHGLGQDARAAQVLRAGMLMLDVLHKSGEYPTLYSAMEPKFEALQRQLKPPAP